VQDTGAFIKKVIVWWKIINVKAYDAVGRHRELVVDVIFCITTS